MPFIYSADDCGPSRPLELLMWEIHGWASELDDNSGPMGIQQAVASLALFLARDVIFDFVSARPVTDREIVVSFWTAAITAAEKMVHEPIVGADLGSFLAAVIDAADKFFPGYTHPADGF